MRLDAWVGRFQPRQPALGPPSELNPCEILTITMMVKLTKSYEPEEILG